MTLLAEWQKGIQPADNLNQLSQKNISFRTNGGKILAGKIGLPKKWPVKQFVCGVEGGMGCGMCV